MKNKLLKIGTFFIALIGISSNEVYSSENTVKPKAQCINNIKVTETTPLYLDDAAPESENTILAWHSSHRSHVSHASHRSHYSSRF